MSTVDVSGAASLPCSDCLIGWIVGVLLVPALGGCAESNLPSQNKLPGRVEQVAQYDSFRPEDLDGDGQDEHIQINSFLPRLERGSVVLLSSERVAIEQVNLPGRIGGYRTGDLENDGKKELFLPYQSGDSLFVSIVGAEGNRKGHFLVTTVAPRNVPEGQVGWQPKIVDMFSEDVTGNGSPEIVTVASVHPPPEPRGVWVHTLEGEEVGRLNVGALLEDAYRRDFTGDGISEVLTASQATNNGGDEGGLDDRHAYLALFEVQETPQLLWKQRIGELWTNAHLRRAELGGPPQRLDVVGYRETTEARGTRNGKIWLFQADADQPIAYSHTLDRPIQHLVPADLNQDGIDEILVLTAEGTVLVLDHRLRIQEHRALDFPLTELRVLPDVSGDGVPELLTRAEGKTLFLGPDLQMQAVSNRQGSWHLMKQGAGRPSLLVHRGDSEAQVFRWASNRWYWAYRYGPWTGVLFGLIAVGGGTLWGWRHLRRHRRLRGLKEWLWSQPEEGFLLYRPREGIIDQNPATADLLSRAGGRSEREDRTDEVPSELVRWLEEVCRGGYQPRERELVVGEERFAVRADPLPDGTRGTCWLVRLSSMRHDDDYRTWGLMAQRVAHDLKNPLTSILLTVQRMQMAYHEEEQQDGALTETLDDYTERIEERIGTLRRMTTNVLKFVGQEDLHRTPTDLGRFLSETAETIGQSIPPDIELCRELDEDLPPVHVDQDQLRSVLENLISNAIEAMHEGGRLTLSTRLARNLSFGEDTARDYVVVEVLDTGTGMTPTERRRLFEPGFSTRDGTGLGMAIVRKIIDDHGGHIEVESEPETGTCVTLYLPAKTAEAGVRGE